MSASAVSVAALENKASSIVPRQRFIIGTKIVKSFDVDGEMQAYRGKVRCFEPFQDEDCTIAWGYLIHYVDGDKEHMFEADVAKHVKPSKSRKRVRDDKENHKEFSRGSSKRFIIGCCKRRTSALVATAQPKKPRHHRLY